MIILIKKVFKKLQFVQIVYSSYKDKKQNQNQ